LLNDLFLSLLVLFFFLKRILIEVANIKKNKMLYIDYGIIFNFNQIKIYICKRKKII